MMKPKRIGLLLWHKLLLLMAGSIIVVAMGLAFATWWSLAQASRQIGLDGKEILSDQTETFLVKLLNGQADTLDLQLAQAQAAAAYGATFLSENLAAGSLDGASLDMLLPTLLEHAKNSPTVYFVTPTGDLQVYPALGSELELPPDFNLTQEPFFPTPSDFQKQAGEVVWSQVHVNPLVVDYDLVVDAIIPIVIDEVRQGYLGVSVSLTQLIAQFNQQQPIRGSYSFLIDRNRQLVAAPPHARVDLSPPTIPVTRGVIDLSDTGNPKLNAALQSMVLGQTSLEKVVIKGEPKYLAYQPLNNIEWRLGIVVPVPLATVASAQLVKVVEAGSRQALTGMLFWAGGLLLVTLVMGGVLTRRLVSPLRDMAIVAESIADGDLERRVEVTTHDEIGNLADAFNSMTAQLRDLISSLEQRVAERTRQLERRAVQLMTAAEVSQAITGTLDPEKLLSQTVELITDRFDLYYAGLFLLDEAGEWAVLRAATGGQAGQQMLAQGHRLEVGGTSMVGWCTANAQARIALDVGEEAIRFDNPLLPDTRSEMALPLVSRGRVIGALDVQSTEGAAFTDEDVAVLQTMAGQLANAIENARLFQETQKHLEEISRLHQRYLRQEWQEYLADEETRKVSAYLYDRGTVRPADDVWMPEIALATQRGETIVLSEMATALQESMEAIGASLQASASSPGNPVAQNTHAKAALAVPLKLRGQVIGALDFYETEQPRQWSSDDIALVESVAEQVALAVENARAYAELQKTAEELREMDRLKTLFLANMSHELRTPLNSIIGFSRVMLKGIDGPLTELQKADLTSIYNNGQHLLGLINDILDMSRIEAGKIELILEPIDLQHIINGVMSTAMALVKDKPINLVQEIEPDLPVIRADGTRLRQVILNLLSNAAKFTEEGQITLRAWADGEQLTISVSDTGPGIASEDQSMLFQEFSQVDASPTRRAGGAGLGLAISRHLVEMHGGRIWVESEVGVGSTFFFTLPIEGAKPIEIPDLAGVKIDPTRKLVLAIEDDKNTVSLYERYLDKAGYQVVALDQGEEATHWARELSPYAIILDVLLPDTDGWAVLEELKKSRETHHIPVIICTIVREEARGLSMGAVEYLVKPILEEELVQALDRLEELLDIR